MSEVGSHVCPIEAFSAMASPVCFVVPSRLSEIKGKSLWNGASDVRWLATKSGRAAAGVK
jgi:hypothetical protein